MLNSRRAVVRFPIAMNNSMNTMVASLRKKLQDLVVGDRVRQLCKDSLDQLSPADHEIVSALMESVPEVVAEFKRYAQVTVAAAQDMDAARATQLMRQAKDFLAKPSTKQLVHSLIDKYGDVLRSPQQMSAIGAYLHCVINNLDDAYKDAAFAAVDMVLAALELLSSDRKIQTFARQAGANWNQNVGSRMMELHAANSANAANGASGANGATGKNSAAATRNATAMDHQGGCYGRSNGAKRPAGGAASGSKRGASARPSSPNGRSSASSKRTGSAAAAEGGKPRATSGRGRSNGTSGRSGRHSSMSPHRR